MIPVLLNGLAALPCAAWIVAVYRRSQRGLPITTLVRAVAIAVAISYVLAHVNRWFDLWKAHPYFPSGHETFAACMGTALVAIDRRFLWPVLLVLAVLGYGLVRAGWHGRYEVIAGFLLGTVVATAALRLFRNVYGPTATP